MLDLVELFERKVELAERLRSMLSEGEAAEAEADPHAWRLPRPCGLTIHTGVGCSFNCIYCYIGDMGFSGRPRPYHLSGVQLAYSVVLNPAVAPGDGGTLLAFGSVTEPFMPESRERCLEYISAVSRELGNPIQLSTKAHLASGLASRVAGSCGRCSFLVTVVTLSYHRVLEPGAPPPEERFETMRNLRAAGLHVSLFLRPIIPGIDMEEFMRILEMARESGAVGVVLGSMRVTERIINNLRRSGFPHVDEVLRRLPGGLMGSRQITLREADLKKRLAGIAEEMDLRVYPSACAANVDAHSLSCAACRLGPCGDRDNLPEFDPASISRVSERYGVRVSKIRVEGSVIMVRAEGDAGAKSRFREFVKAATRRMVLVG